MSFIKVNDRVELICQASFEVMTLPFGLWQIDHTDSAFQTRIANCDRRRHVVAERKQEVRGGDVVKGRFITVCKRWAYSFSFGWSIPVRRSSHRGRISCKSDQHSLRSVSLAHKLADIYFTIVSHVGCASVTQMRVVLPHSYLCVLSLIV